eukprot:COSAG02_NODE_59018_length_275_cov_1.073864_1_plen_68_part_10
MTTAASEAVESEVHRPLDLANRPMSVVLAAEQERLPSLSTRTARIQLLLQTVRLILGRSCADVAPTPS